MMSEKVQTSMLEDYVKYSVGNRTIHTKDVAELGTWLFHVFKLYIHETNSDNKVEFGYRFIAPEFIPSCLVNIYSIDSNKNINSYLGSNEIDESQKDDEVDIKVGESTMLQCRSLIVISNNVTVQDEATARKYQLPLDTFSQDYVRRDERTWHIITNHNIKSSPLIIKHHVGNKLIISVTCQTYKRRKNGYIEWYFQVPAGTTYEPRKETFICKIITAGYY